MVSMKLAPHEHYEIHELIQLNNIRALKASGLTNNVADPALRSLLERDLENAQTNIQELRGYLQEALNQAQENPI